jgi:hypothetical protein
VFRLAGVNAEAHHDGIISFDIAILRHKENCTTTQFFSTLPAKPLKSTISPGGITASRERSPRPTPALRRVRK